MPQSAQEAVEGLDILLKKLDTLFDTEHQILTKETVPDLLTDDGILANLAQEAAEICAEVLTFQDKDYRRRDRAFDRFLTGKFTGSLTMLLLLALVFWITSRRRQLPVCPAFRTFPLPGTGAFQSMSSSAACSFGFADKRYLPHAYLGSGRDAAPMAIFFPLFTLLEDVGYLPRIAYNLDYCFQKCKACGKQALTMAMGFGCNCVGVLGCRIIDSPRERMIALLTNSFVPCNGRFPTLIALIGLSTRLLPFMLRCFSPALFCSAY